MTISIVIMAHPDRAFSAVGLYNQLVEMPFRTCSIEWDNSDIEWKTGRAAWLSHKDSDWSIVIQEDAIMGANFYDNVVNAIKAVPQETCISFYLGTTRPYNNKITKAFKEAISSGASWLAGKSLHHGVCVAMPTHKIEDVISYVEKTKPGLNYDFKIGSYFQKHKLPVYYTMPSLCDHNDELPSLTNHKVVSGRVARNYESDFVGNWNNKVVEIGV